MAKKKVFVIKHNKKDTETIPYNIYGYKTNEQTVKFIYLINKNIQNTFILSNSSLNKKTDNNQIKFPVFVSKQKSGYESIHIVQNKITEKKHIDGQLFSQLKNNYLFELKENYDFLLFIPKKNYFNINHLNSVSINIWNYSWKIIEPRKIKPFPIF